MSTGVRGGQWLCAIILVRFLSPHVYSYNGGKGLWDKLTPVTLIERRMVYNCTVYFSSVLIICSYQRIYRDEIKTVKFYRALQNVLFHLTVSS